MRGGSAAARWRTSRAIGTLSAEQAHEAAIQRMAYLFAAVEDTDSFVARVRAFQPATG